MRYKFFVIIFLFTVALFGVSGPLIAMEVWNASPVDVVTPDSKAVPGAPAIDIFAPRNGAASGQVVVSSNVPVQGSVSDLASVSGGKIPATAIQVRYATSLMDLSGRTDLEIKPGVRCDALSEKPLTGQPVQPVWITVEVLAATVAGDYTGTLTIRGDAQLKVPVTLHVSSMLMPARKDTITWVGLLQQINAVSDRYGVPLYSDEHFKYLEPSFKLLGKLGHHVMYVPVIEMNFNGIKRGLITFDRSGNTLVPNYSALDRYLAMQIKHCGVPRAVVVEVWQVYMGMKEGDFKDGLRTKDKAPVSVRKGTGFETVDVPLYPADEAFWVATWKGAVEHLVKAGVPRSAIHIGTFSDRRPNAEQAAFWKKVDPDLGWGGYTHGYGGINIPEGRISYCESPDLYAGHFQKKPARGSGDTSRWVRLSPVRDMGMNFDIAPLMMIRRLPDVAVGQVEGNGASVGLGRTGFDSWTVIGEEEKKPINHFNEKQWLYSKHGRLIRSITRSFTAPGPAGAIATQRYEILREGVQDCEARVIIEKAYIADSLDPVLKADAEAMLNVWNSPFMAQKNTPEAAIPLIDKITPDWQKRTKNLLDLAGRVQAKK